MFEVGRLVVKIAGRDARKVGVVIDNIDAHTVLVDGQTRRRKVNVTHLEPLNKTVQVGKGAATADVAKALGDAGFEVVEKKNSHESAKRQEKKRSGKKAQPAKTTKKATKANAE